MLHVLEARGNANHGASYALQYRDMFDNGGPLERHLYFQWALFLLDLGRYDRILKFLEVHIFQPRLSEPHAALTVADATQLFWRLHFAGQDAEELHEQLHGAWTALVVDEQEQRVVFSPFTLLMCHVRARDEPSGHSPCCRTTVVVLLDGEADDYVDLCV